MGNISKFRALKKCPRVILRALLVFLVKNNHNCQLKVKCLHLIGILLTKTSFGFLKKTHINLGSLNDHRTHL